MRKHIKEDSPWDPKTRNAIKMNAATGVDFINVKKGDKNE